MESYEQYRRGRLAFENEDYAGALEYLRAALDIEENYKTHGLMSEALMRSGDGTGAFLHAERAYELNPLNDEVCVAYAEHLLRRGEREDAMRVVRETLDRNQYYGPAEILRMTLEH